MSPAGFSCLLFIAVLVCHWVPAGCYANGKVAKACHGMEPSHHARGQSTPSPYILTVNATTYGPGDQILVVLSGSTYFTGFLLQARDTPNQGSASIVGTFTLMDPKRTQLLTCNKLKGSAVSHTTAVQKKEVAVIWTPPSYPAVQVQFFVTVVQEFKVFWVKLPGPIINEEGFTPNPTQPGTRTTPPSLQTTTTSILPEPMTSQGCGQSKSCLLDPPGCDPKEDPLCFFLSMTTEGPKLVMFELSGPADGYIAFALSLDTWMGNDDVYMCVKEGDRVSVSAAFVLGRTHPEDESQSGLSSVSWRLADGAIQCRFSRPVRLANQEPARYDLDRGYYLFLANGQSRKGVLLQHSRQPLISTQSKLITGPPEVLRGSRAPTLMKMHGSLMMLAWMLTGSVGTFIASFYKPDWPNQSLLGQKVWFQVHRGLMMLTLALTFASFCLPFFYRSGWSKGAGLHPYLGLSVLALSLIQPLMAAVRPPPDSGRRYIFNWAHFGFGTATEIMAVIAMSTGMRQSSLLLPQPWATHVLIGYVTWLVSFRTGFLIHMHCTCTLKKSLINSDQSELIPSDQSENNSLSAFMKSLLLAVFALGNAGFLVALLSSVAKL
ncbi:putative ferric-chelate reductase 1 [Labrus mixtus]|uniref:putative ferric-chelate reductase 1 n=1 Tax=Labrus mixtus TaxID=508554 RepID=UPI0029BFEB2B|nr:putative ferric-chelate reductase 1 [Labrus mixtus]XP_060899793.1 putative ferric-chelate reductase 1 [Labrus mixtus]